MRYSPLRAGTRRWTGTATRAGGATSTCRRGRCSTRAVVAPRWPGRRPSWATTPWLSYPDSTRTTARGTHSLIRVGSYFLLLDTVKCIRTEVLKYFVWHTSWVYDKEAHKKLFSWYHSACTRTDKQHFIIWLWKLLSLSLWMFCFWKCLKLCLFNLS